MPISTPALLLRSALAVACVVATLPAARAQQYAPPLWLNAYTPGFAPVASSSLASDAQGNTYAAFSFTGSITIGGTMLTSQGLSDGCLVKYTPTGTVAWILPFSTATNESAADVALDAAGNAYVTGSFTSPLQVGGGNGVQLSSSSTAAKVFVVRVSPQGVPEWAQQSAPGASTSANGYSVDVDAQGNVYACGLYSGSVFFGPAAVGATSRTGFGVFLLRLRAATGEAQAAAAAFDYQPAPPPVTYQLPRLAVGAGGSVYIANSFAVPLEVSGTSYTTRGNNDLLVVKYSAQGMAEWVRQEGGPDEDRVTDAAVDGNDNLYLTGTFDGVTTFGTTALPWAGGLDGFLAKYSPLGALLWVQAHGGPGSDGWGSVSLDAGGAPHVAGHFSTGARLGSSTLTAVGSNDIVVASYRPEGQLGWVQQAGGTGSDVGFHIGFRQPYLYVFGTFTGSCSFGGRPVSSTTTTTANFLARLGDPTLATQAARPRTLGLYPNPAFDQLHLPTLPAGTPVQLLDALGRLARATTVSAAAQVSVRGLTPGLYTLRATTPAGPYQARVVVK
ncbi:T9SS type A sorting domain-containing protein [Hymenobacter sp. BT635]|uniref:T9SS type A sorting domain-containing protein n=1 Tax=Hymenobacter nitidus TaxID=2880929 RepID=A0ABS8AA08_9BACT|nr:T9SS type A sorting domain-containing protein [Hymenobacter nitidus]MCB2377233.1 T9SS type A sorting domain-containing protein [Hymenobacter nitidus]